MIIGLSGKIKSGKTTVTEYFGKKKFTVLSTSKLLKKLLKANNLEENRENLQYLGGDLLNLVGGGGFMEIMFFNLPESDYIIDSIRHVGASTYLRNKYGKNYYHIYVKSSDSVRYSRIKEKYGIDDRSLIEKWESAETETANDDLERLADVIITSDGSVDELYHQLDIFYNKIR